MHHARARPQRARSDHEDYKTLSAHLGEPDSGLADNDDLLQWTIDSPAGRIHLLNLRGRAHPDRLADSPIGWAVEAATDAALPWVYKVVTGSTAGFPTAAHDLFGESTLASFTRAYVDYLFLRHEALLAWVNELDRTSDEYFANRILPRQFNNMALSVAELLLHHEWAQASKSERIAWVGMGRPHSAACESKLSQWHGELRWIHAPSSADSPPILGAHDLAGMLLDLANRRTNLREALGAHRMPVDLDGYDEHVATLRALASTPIPGPDSILRPGVE